MTVKERDGANDKASQLDREGVFRLNLGVGKEKYRELFGPTPARPPKGGVVDTGHDFTALDRLTPHPIYAWMGWVSMLSPTEASFKSLLPLLDVAYRRAQNAFEKRVAK